MMLLTNVRGTSRACTPIVGVVFGAALGAFCTTPLAAGAAPENIHVNLPLTATEWTAGVNRLTVVFRQSLGIEVMPPPGPLKSWSDRQLDLTGLSPLGALNLLQQHDPEYVVTETDGIVVVRPKSAINNREDFLNHRIARFDADGVTVVDALVLIHRLFDPAHRRLDHARTNIDKGGRLTPARAEIVATGFDRRFSVHLANVTVRQVLDAVVVAHGAISWNVSYHRAPAVYENVLIRFYGFDNWSIGDAARSRKTRSPAND